MRPGKAVLTGGRPFELSRAVASAARDVAYAYPPAGSTKIDHLLSLDDGRTVCWREFGAADGQPVIALHGTPGSRLKYSAAHDTARVLGLRLLSLDRWGYGSTSSHPNPSLGTYGAEIAQFADRLGLDRFSVVGVSGGGPFAVAVAAILGQRVRRLALVAPVGQLAGSQPVRDMRAFHWSSFRMLPAVPGAVRLTFEVYRWLLAFAPKTAITLASARAKGADRALVADPDIRNQLAATFATGLKPGVAGAVTDMSLFARRWDVVPSNVHAHTRMWIGTADCNIPLSAARQLCAMIPRSIAVELEGQGHFWISRNYADVLEWLALGT
jgi:pimeloyl-ACP methyl ester carboxylesterase